VTTQLLSRYAQAAILWRFMWNDLLIGNHAYRINAVD